MIRRPIASSFVHAAHNPFTNWPCLALHFCHAKFAASHLPCIAVLPHATSRYLHHMLAPALARVSGADDERPRAALSKSAKKNAARRARAVPHASDAPAQPAHPSTPPGDEAAADAAAAQLQRATIADSSGAAEQPIEVDDADAQRRRLRALRKKVRLCLERVRAEEAKGGELSEELKGRLANVVDWCAPVQGICCDVHRSHALLQVVLRGTVRCSDGHAMGRGCTGAPRCREAEIAALEVQVQDS